MSLLELYVVFPVRLTHPGQKSESTLRGLANPFTTIDGKHVPPRAGSYGPSIRMIRLKMYYRDVLPSINIKSRIVYARSHSSSSYHIDDRHYIITLQNLVTLTMSPVVVFKSNRAGVGAQCETGYKRRPWS